MAHIQQFPVSVNQARRIAREIRKSNPSATVRIVGRRGVHFVAEDTKGMTLLHGKEYRKEHIPRSLRGRSVLPPRILVHHMGGGE